MKRNKIQIPKRLIILLFLAIMSYANIYAQYTGGSGDGYASAASGIINFSDVSPEVPKAPVAIAATSITAGSFSTNWNVSTLATGYYLDVDDNSDFSSPLSSYNNLDVNNVTTYAVSGLAPNHTYYYRLRAYNAGGTSENSDTINLTTLQQALSITGISISNKTYDGNTTATITGTPVLNGIYGSESVNLLTTDASALFAGKNVETGKSVTVSGYTITGADAANYTLTQPTGLTADITAKTLTITGVSANNKEYDGTTVATLTGGTLSGLVEGDDVTLTAGTGEFSDPNAGTGKTVTAKGFAISGTDASNYSLEQPSGLTADISKATPVITWENPTDIVSGTALNATQLNATVNIDGTFVYTPASGTVLGVGNNQQLKADFTPTDGTNYNTASKTVSINVLPSTGVEEISGNKVLLYPNPVNELITLSGLPAISGGKPVVVKIVNQQGKTVMVKTIKNASDSEQINLGRLPNGTYFIQLDTGKTRVVKHFVKQ